ncbi:MAG: hypothetical protein JXQ73_18025 [Phycisphaerae bacterium]|nr:hypothetical protein [Phycisphaerae bacterium]
MGLLSGQIGRGVTAALVFVAASYHLTESARRQTELAHQRQEQERQARDTSPGDKDDGSKPRKQVLIWVAPDMADRLGASCAGLDETVRVSKSGPAGLPPDGESIISLSVSRAARLETFVADPMPGCRVRLSDRSPNGPPTLA